MGIFRMLFSKSTDNQITRLLPAKDSCSVPSWLLMAVFVVGLVGIFNVPFVWPLPPALWLRRSAPGVVLHNPAARYLLKLGLSDHL